VDLRHQLLHRPAVALGLESPSTDVLKKEEALSTIEAAKQSGLPSA